MELKLEEIVLAYQTFDIVPKSCFTPKNRVNCGCPSMALAALRLGSVEAWLRKCNAEHPRRNSAVAAEVIGLTQSQLWGLIYGFDDAMENCSNKPRRGISVGDNRKEFVEAYDVGYAVPGALAAVGIGV